MQCAYCGQPLSPPGAFCGSCGRAQPAPALPERLYYSGPGHAQVERDLASIVASIISITATISYQTTSESLLLPCQDDR